MKSLQSKFWQTLFYPRMLNTRRYFEYLGTHTFALQRQALQDSLCVVNNSDMAKHFGLRSAWEIEDFQARVPINDYKDLEPFFTRLYEGSHKAVLNRFVNLRMFAMSSGTTGNRKYLPITDAGAWSMQRTWRHWGVGTVYDHPEIIGTKFMRLSSDWRACRSPYGVPCGDMSGYLASLQPWYVERAFKPNQLVEKVSSQPAKYYLSLLLTLVDENIRFISTATPNTLIRLAHWNNEWKEPLIRDLHDGSVPAWVRGELSVELMQQLRKFLPRDRQRARHLTRVSERQGELLPKHCWPRMRLIATWTGGNFRSYLKLVRDNYGDVAIRDLGLTASEGVMTIPTRDDAAAGILNVENNFYEFRPVGEKRVTFLASELELGQDYDLIITTPNGLLRYDLQDIVRVEGFHGQAPLLSFVGKAQHISDLTGEKLSPQQVSQAVAAMQEELGTSIGRYVIVPDAGIERPGYCLMVEEFDREKADLGALLDEHLQLQNYIYQEHRQAGKLAPVRVRFVRPGSFLKLDCAGIEAQQASLAQYKPPCLIPDASFVKKFS